MNTEQFNEHTPGPWHEILMQGDEYDNGYADLQKRGFNGAAQDLIAAAPDLLAEVKRLRDLHILACDYLSSISDGTLPDSEWPHIHAMIRGEEE